MYMYMYIQALTCISYTVHVVVIYMFMYRCEYTHVHTHMYMWFALTVPFSRLSSHNVQRTCTCISPMQGGRCAAEEEEQSAAAAEWGVSCGEAPGTGGGCGGRTESGRPASSLPPS